MKELVEISAVVFGAVAYGLAGVGFCALALVTLGIPAAVVAFFVYEIGTLWAAQRLGWMP